MKYRIFAPDDYAHTARIEENFYNQRSMTEIVSSSIKRSNSLVVRARKWYDGFYEGFLMYLVYNSKQYVTRWF